MTEPAEEIEAEVVPLRRRVELLEPAYYAVRSALDVAIDAAKDRRDKLKALERAIEASEQKKRTASAGFQPEPKPIALIDGVQLSANDIRLAWVAQDKQVDAFEKASKAMAEGVWMQGDKVAE